MKTFLNSQSNKWYKFKILIIYNNMNQQEEFIKFYLNEELQKLQPNKSENLLTYLALIGIESLQEEIYKMKESDLRQRCILIVKEKTIKESY